MWRTAWALSLAVSSLRAGRETHWELNSNLWARAIYFRQRTLHPPESNHLAWDVGLCLSHQSRATASVLISDLRSALCKGSQAPLLIATDIFRLFSRDTKTWAAGTGAGQDKLDGCFLQHSATAMFSNWCHRGHSCKNSGWCLFSPTPASQHQWQSI